MSYQPLGYPPPSSGGRDAPPRLLASTMRTLRTLPRIVYILASFLAFLLLVLTSHRASPDTLPALKGHLSAQASSLSAYLSRLAAGATPSIEMTYRQHLELTTSPKEQITHSDTMGFDHIYVLSLPSRLDRRQQMSQLGAALGVKITFVDAALKNEPFIKWIGERVGEQRKFRRKALAQYRGVKENKIGGLHMHSDWLVPYLDADKLEPFPAYPSDKRFPGTNWAAHLEDLHDKDQHLSLKPYDSNINVTELLWDERESYDVRQVHEGIISTFWGQTRAMKLIVKNGDKSALIMEDDVDVEWDLERFWSRIKRRLPGEEGGGNGLSGAWDAVFLGHCWGHELLKPGYLHPWLHQSTSPMCLHGYVLSGQGAKNLLDSLLDPWTAYATAIDLAVPTFLAALKMHAFSMTPPLIIQRKDGLSDLQGGTGSPWRGALRDSTIERIALFDGEEVVERTVEDSLRDPGNVFREQFGCDLGPTDKELVKQIIAGTGF